MVPVSVTILQYHILYYQVIITTKLTSIFNVVAANFNYFMYCCVCIVS